MQLSCLQENLERGLTAVRSAVPSRTTMPVLDNVLLETRQGMLQLTATDLTTTIITQCGAMIETEGSIAIPHRMLYDLVRALPSDRIDLGVDESNVQISCGRSVTNITGVAAEDYPGRPKTTDDAATVTIDAAQLSKAIGMVRYAAATDEGRPVLTGVLVEFNESSVRFIAADGFRLAIQDIPLPEPMENVSAIVPAVAMREVQRLANEERRPVAVSIPKDRSWIHFKFDHTELFSQLIQGAFPNVDQLVPDSYTTRIVVDRDDLMNQVQIASAMTKDKGKQVIRMTFEPNEEEGPSQMQVSAAAEGQGNTTSSFDTKDFEGESNRIAINQRYLAEFLSANQGEICIKITTSTSPMLLEPAEVDNSRYVAMPMYVQW